MNEWYVVEKSAITDGVKIVLCTLCIENNDRVALILEIYYLVLIRPPDLFLYS